MPKAYRTAVALQATLLLFAMGRFAPAIRTKAGVLRRLQDMGQEPVAGE